MRDLDQEAGPVARIAFAAASTRWLMFSRAVKPSRTNWCDFRPLMSAMKPTAQASCSFAGS